MKSATKPGFPGYFFGKNIVTRLNAAPGKVTPACPTDDFILKSRALSDHYRQGKMKTTSKLIAISMLGLAILQTTQANEAYRCETDDGKIMIQSVPCDQKPPANEIEKKKPEKPDYSEIVRESMKKSASKQLKSLNGN